MCASAAKRWSARCQRTRFRQRLCTASSQHTTSCFKAYHSVLQSVLLARPAPSRVDKHCAPAQLRRCDKFDCIARAPLHPLQPHTAQPAPVPYRHVYLLLSVVWPPTPLPALYHERCHRSCRAHCSSLSSNASMLCAAHRNNAHSHSTHHARFHCRGRSGRQALRSLRLLGIAWPRVH